MLTENTDKTLVIGQDLTFKEFTCTSGARADLGARDVHLWTIVLSNFFALIPELYYLLSFEERERASSFRFSSDRQRYILAHAIRRRILAHYLRVSPFKIEICEGTFGKPRLRAVSEEVSFNDSRSGDLAVYAITRGRPVGIDVEYVRPLPQLREIARAYFSSPEIKTLASAPEQSRSQQFFTMWCGKESVLKCTGEGIGQHLNMVETDLTAPQRMAVLYAGKATRLTTAWHLHSYCPAADHEAVVATTQTNLLFSHGTINPSLNVPTRKYEQA